MSWNTGNIGPVAIADLEAALAATPLLGPDTPEHQEQYAVAKQAVLAIARSGAVGDPATAHVFLWLGGHGNSGHTPLAGWANDSINLSISQFTPEPAITPAPAPTLSAPVELALEPVIE